MLNYGKWGKSVMSIGADIPLRHSLRQLLKPPGNTWHCRVFKWKFCLSIYFVQNGPLYGNFLRERMQEKAEGVFGQWQFIYSLPPLYLRTPWGEFYFPLQEDGTWWLIHKIYNAGRDSIQSLFSIGLGRQWWRYYYGLPSGCQPLYARRHAEELIIKQSFFCSCWPKWLKQKLKRFKC